MGALFHGWWRGGWQHLSRRGLSLGCGCVSGVQMLPSSLSLSPSLGSTRPPDLRVQKVLSSHWDFVRGPELLLAPWAGRSPCESRVSARPVGGGFQEEGLGLGLRVAASGKGSARRRRPCPLIPLALAVPTSTEFSTFWFGFRSWIMAEAPPNVLSLS